MDSISLLCSHSKQLAKLQKSHHKRVLFFNIYDFLKNLKSNRLLKLLSVNL